LIYYVNLGNTEECDYTGTPGILIEKREFGDGTTFREFYADQMCLEFLCDDSRGYPTFSLRKIHLDLKNFLFNTANPGDYPPTSCTYECLTWEPDMDVFDPLLGTAVTPAFCQVNGFTFGQGGIVTACGDGDVVWHLAR
jgi:hypothetical protein